MTFICTSDRYTNEAESFDSVEDFLAMCEGCFGEAPELRVIDGVYHDDHGPVLHPEGE